MTLSKTRKGELSILCGAIIWGFFPIVTILSFNKLPTLISLGMSTFLAAIFFAVLLTINKKWHEIKNKSALKDIIWVALFSGIAYYAFYFFGLKYTSAGNASIIIVTEILFSFLFFHVWKKDYIPREHIIGSILMLLGACIVLYPNVTKFHLGDVLVLGAAIVAPFGNFFQRKARDKVSSISILFIRSVITTIFVLLLAMLLGEKFSFIGIKNSWIVLLINGVIMFGLSKILWIEAIHRITVTKSNAISSLSVLLTIFFAWIILKNNPSSWQLLSIIPIIPGMILLGVNRNKPKLKK